MGLPKTKPKQTQPHLPSPRRLFQPSHDGRLRITTRTPSTPSISTSTSTTTAIIRHIHSTPIPIFPSYSASNQPNSLNLPDFTHRSPLNAHSSP
ncbi:hypothetical protein K435DRAFT_784240 [Dendrothele bispora CBS 962.96]|uniref:Uncharacterized protein n=1 Tax=Dendrothele bispora (strain CBS 962.96) TaxID=1314807 RepID=A0A4S8L431_DENBC|nr:hypothetical protein K435DRAFT_784240 [Dendrothele bispora CBS 962.96]